MKEIHYRIILILIILVNLNSKCNEKSEESVYKFTNNIDTVEIDIPEWANDKGFSRNMLRSFNSLMNLESIEKGFDSLQIRIWIDCGDAMSSLIVLSSRSNVWSGIFYSFKFHLKNGTNFEVKGLKKKYLTPISGWSTFSAKLINTGIMELPDHSTFAPNYNLPNDGEGVMVEVSTTKKYRLYRYPSMSLNININNGPSKLNKAIELIEKEFMFTRPCEIAN